MNDGTDIAWTQVFVLLIMALQRSSDTVAKFGIHRDLSAVFDFDALQGLYVCVCARERARERARAHTHERENMEHRTVRPAAMG